MTTPTSARLRAVGPATFGVIALVTTVIAYTVTIGADAMWLVAMGDTIAAKGAIPGGVPFFATDTSAWVNVPVLGELLFSAIDRLAPWGLLSAQLIAVAVTLILLTAGSRRLGARDGSTATAILLFATGSLAALGVVRIQLVSLPLFALLVLLLRAEHDRPSRRIWLIVPLVALWANLHGAVLVGIAVAGSYLLCSRWRRDRATTLGVLVVMLSTLWWTPGGLRSHEYYLTVLANEAAKRHEGLWAPISLPSPLDILLVAAGSLLLIAALRRRIPLWEWVAAAGLVIMTAQAARHGVWLLAFLTPRAAKALTRPYAAEPSSAAKASPVGGWAQRLVAGVVLAALVVAWGFGISERGTSVAANSRTAEAISQAIGPDRVTLAPSPLAESLAVWGLTLYAGNPLDALPGVRQRAYLDFLRSPDTAATLSPRPGAVVVAGDAVTPALEAAFPNVRHVAGYRVYFGGEPGTHTA